MRSQEKLSKFERLENGKANFFCHEAVKLGMKNKILTKELQKKKGDNCDGF